MDFFGTPMQSPSNQARLKKTMIEITNIQCYSLDKENSKKNNSNQFISLGKKKVPTEANQEEPHSKKKIVLKERQDSNLAFNQCKNHKGRKAVNIVQNKKSNILLCFECSILEGAKRKSNQHEQKSNDKKCKSRQYEIQSYMTKSYDVEKNLRNLEIDTINWMQQFLKEVDKIALSFKQDIQSQIRRLKLEYGQKAEELKKLKIYQISQLNATLRDIEKRCKFLVYNRIDVAKNMQDSLSSFSDNQYREVMEKYWMQIENSENLAKEHSKKSLIQKFREEINGLLRRKEKNGEQREFTFSKDQRYDSPQDCKLKGVPIITSNKISSLHQDEISFVS